MANQYYLPVSVYRDADGYDATANGITSREKRLYAPVSDGYVTLEDIERAGESHLILTKDSAGGRVHLKPLERKEGWHMFGGNFVYACDSRFAREYGGAPVAVHDRCES